MDSWKKDRVGSAERGENPTVMVRMKSGFAVIGDNQFLPGYCVLLGYPKVSSLDELSIVEKKQYLIDMTLIGDAILKTCNALRINYSILMNCNDYLHAHIEARYDWETDENKCRPTYFYPKEQRYNREYEYSDEKYGDLKRNITQNLLELMKKADY